MISHVAPVGSRIVDSLPYSQSGTADQARALAASGVDGLVGYLGVISRERVRHVTDAGMGFMGVTLANSFDGVRSAAQARALDLPKGTTLWIDVEGQQAWMTTATELARKIEAWASSITTAGYVAGIYVGTPQPLTGKELYNLKGITRYWLGIGRCVGRDGRDAYPDCGWCMRQDWHAAGNGLLWRGTGVLVDTNSVQADHRGRLPTWALT